MSNGKKCPNGQTDQPPTTPSHGEKRENFEKKLKLIGRKKEDNWFSHYGPEQKKKHSKNSHPASERMSEWASEWMSEGVSAAERASKASRAEQANELAVQVNEQTDKQLAQYFSLYSCYSGP